MTTPELEYAINEARLALRILEQAAADSDPDRISERRFLYEARRQLRQAALAVQPAVQRSLTLEREQSASNPVFAPPYSPDGRKGFLY